MASVFIAVYVMNTDAVFFCQPSEPACRGIADEEYRREKYGQFINLCVHILQKPDLSGMIGTT